MEITQCKVTVALVRDERGVNAVDTALDTALGKPSNTASDPAFGSAMPDRPRIKGHRQAWCPQHGALVSMPVLDRQALRPGDRFTGPLLVEEGQTTSVIGAGDRLEVHQQGHLVVHIDGQRPS